MEAAPYAYRSQVTGHCNISYIRQVLELVHCTSINSLHVVHIQLFSDYCKLTHPLTALIDCPDPCITGRRSSARDNKLEGARPPLSFENVALQVMCNALVDPSLFQWVRVGWERFH